MSAPSHRVLRLPPERNATLDTLRWARTRPLVPVLLEVDVTAARAALRERRHAGGVGLSFTAWVVSCVARAAAEHPRVHAVRHGRSRVVLFDEVDVAVPIERRVRGGAEVETLPMPLVVRGAERKSAAEIHAEIRDAQRVRVDGGASSIGSATPPRLQALFFRLPAPLRDLVLWRRLLADPFRLKRTMGTVAVTAAGMSAPGVLGWGVPLSIHPLTVAVGGIGRRGAPAGGTEVLALTVVFDHSVTDGAPVGRFVHRLHQMMTDAADGIGPPDMPRQPS